MTHPRPRLSEIRATIRAATLEDESSTVRERIDAAGLARADRESIVARAVDLVRTTRARAGTSIMQGFLAEYGLSTREGVALMCLAEALLRVPDTETIDALIEDKIGASDWAAHLGHSSPPLVNASTWALLLTGKVLGEAEEGLAGALREAHGTRCRIYAPVGAHHDLLAYLVRRLLENGANSSFVNQIVDERVTPEEIARDPTTVIEGLGRAVANPRIVAPADIFMPQRGNSKGWDLTDPLAMAAIEAEREQFRTAVWEAGPLIAGKAAGAERAEMRNPDVRNLEVRTPEVRTPEVRTSEVRNPEVRTPEVRTSEVRNPEVRTLEVRTSEVRNPKVRTPEVRIPDTRNPVERVPEVGNPENTDAFVRHHGRDGRVHAVRNPARTEEIVGHVTHATPADVEAAL